MKPLYWWLFANLWVQHLCKYSPEQGWGWMCSLLLSEVSSYACIISTQCTHEACGYQVWGRFIMKMLVSPPSWWTGLKETKKSPSPPHTQILSLGKGQPLWLSYLHHDAHGLRLWSSLLPLTSWTGIQECVYWLATMQVRHPHLPKHSSGSKLHSCERTTEY